MAYGARDITDYIEGEDNMQRLVDILLAQYGEARGLESRRRLVQFGPELGPETEFPIGTRVTVQNPESGIVYGNGNVIGTPASYDGQFMVRIDARGDAGDLLAPRPWLQPQWLRD